MLDNAAGLLDQLGAAGTALAPHMMHAWKDAVTTRCTMFGLLDPAPVATRWVISVSGRHREDPINGGGGCVSRYGKQVTALWSFDEQPRTGDPLLPGAMPAAIRNALLPEDQAQFDTAYQRALDTAREDMDLTELFRCLEHWRRVALLQRDPARFASIVRRAAERLTGKPVPAGEPLALTRRQVGL